MRLLLIATFFLSSAGPALAQNQRQRNEGEWVNSKPTLGDTVPDVTVYTADGKELKTSDLRGHYTVLTFGCLT